MSRLQKKCLIASGTLHGLLVLIFLTTSAFLIKDTEPVDQQVLTFIPDKLVDEPLQRAASATQPASTPPAAAQPPPAAVAPPQPEPARPQPRQEPPKPQPEPPKAEPIKPKAEPPKEPAKKETKLDPLEVKKPKVEPKVEPKRTQPIAVDTSKRVLRDNSKAIAGQEQRRQAETARAQVAFEARRDQALSNLNALAGKLSSSAVASPLDLGTVGVSYGSLDAWIRKVYMDAWQKPAELQAGDFSVMVKVVIRRDGTVESSSVTDPSGIAKLDKSVRDVLARVKTIGKEFPEGAREEKRSYTIEFNLKATTGAG